MSETSFSFTNPTDKTLKFPTMKNLIKNVKDFFRSLTEWKLHKELKYGSEFHTSRKDGLFVKTADRCRVDIPYGVVHAANWCKIQLEDRCRVVCGDNSTVGMNSHCVAEVGDRSIVSADSCNTIICGKSCRIEAVRCCHIICRDETYLKVGPGCVVHVFYENGTSKIFLEGVDYKPYAFFSV